MENYLKVIPIFFAVDDGYVPFLAVALQSIIENSSKEYFYSIKILYTNIEEENKKKILKYERENIKIEFVDLNYYIEDVKDKLYTRDYYTKTTYFRLFISNLYPQYNKAIYLDSDIVVLGDIAKLYNEDIGDNLVAAVPDDVIQTNKVFQDYVERVVGIATYKNYFNAGMLLMNLDEMRKFDFQNKFLYLLGTVKFAVVQDQDYLNRLCKGRTKLLDKGWDRMPIPTDEIEEKDINLIHYNLTYKPWHFENVLYENFFWNYAKKTEYYDEIQELKNKYTDEERFRDLEQYENLKKLAKKETECVGDDRIYFQRQIDHEKYEQRLKVLRRIEELEKQGIFDKDVEDDPETIPLLPDDVDYLNKKSTSKIKSRIANGVAKRFLGELVRDNKLIIDKINGLENMKNINSGAIITCNHFNPFDSFSIEKVFRIAEMDKTKKLYKVIREGNYTNFPGLYGFFFRNCDTLPLSSSAKTMVEFMKAVDTILQRKDFILIYPEQSMWWNYKKPKPLKDGAFKFAVRNDVPVLPIFITMEDSSIIQDDGFPVQKYTINIEKPIYPDKNLNKKQNINMMRDKNFDVWKNIYENFYDIPLEYETITENVKNAER